MKRIRYIFKGLVQGVGFRPFIYRVASDLSLTGFVKNIGSGVLAEFQGEIENISKIDDYIQKNLPKNAQIEFVEKKEIDVLKNQTSFEIFDSEKGDVSTVVPYDMGICSNCIKEFYDKNHRHYHNFFISCIDCGPRYSMIKSLPYDRENTTMDVFEFCDDCKREYYSPLDRRFNAQSTTCPVCGPNLFLYSFEEDRFIKGSNETLMDKVCEEILAGKIIAAKGIGGFHLIVDPWNKNTVKRLINSKRREGKPMALVCKDIEIVKKYCSVSEAEEELFNSTRCPIILFEANTTEFSYLNDNLSTLGIMRAYTPVLHYLLTRTNRDFLVATSANLSGIPMIIDENEAIEKLKGLADYVLYHNRKIFRRCDDSVGFVINNKFILSRAGRGYSPVTFKINSDLPKVNILALGAHEKTTISIKKDSSIIMTQYLGDMQTKEYIDFYEDTLRKFIELYEFDYDYIACDYHMGYYTTELAKRLSNELNKKLIYVQHHIAHLYSVMLENMLDSCIGFAFDGTGLGLDNNIWGSEGFIIEHTSAKRVFHLDYYPLIGADKSIKEPERLAYYFANIIDKEFAKAFFGDDKKLDLILQTTKNINYPLTSSMGRLFDIVGVFLGCGKKNGYEAQIPMRLESIAQKDEKGFYDVFMKIKHEILINVVDILQAIINDIKRNVDKGIISAKFHNTIAKIVVEVAKVLRENYNKDIVVLSGGVFQNKYLLKKTAEFLEKEGFKVYYNSLFPINDGGISAGQVYYTLKILKNC